MATDVTRWVLLCGLSPLIPLPLVDDWAAARWTARALRELTGGQLDEDALRLLADDHFTWAAGCRTVAIWPFKKLFRTFLVVLTVKDMLDAAARCALRAELVARALAAGDLPGRVAHVRAAMDEALDSHHTSPVVRWALRHPRPALEGATGLPGWLVVQSGGGLVLPRFVEALRG